MTTDILKCPAGVVLEDTSKEQDSRRKPLTATVAKDITQDPDYWLRAVLS